MFRWNFQKASENDLAKPRAIDTVGDNHGSVSLPVTWWCSVSTHRTSPSGKGDLVSIIALHAFLFVEDVSKYLGGSSPVCGAAHPTPVIHKSYGGLFLR